MCQILGQRFNMDDLLLSETFTGNSEGYGGGQIVLATARAKVIGKTSSHRCGQSISHRGGASGLVGSVQEEAIGGLRMSSDAAIVAASKARMTTSEVAGPTSNQRDASILSAANASTAASP